MLPLIATINELLKNSNSLNSIVNLYERNSVRGTLWEEPLWEELYENSMRGSPAGRTVGDWLPRITRELPAPNYRLWHSRTSWQSLTHSIWLSCRMQSHVQSSHMYRTVFNTVYCNVILCRICVQCICHHSRRLEASVRGLIRRNAGHITIRTEESSVKIVKKIGRPF